MNFYKISNKLAIKGVDTFIELSKEGLEILTWKEDNVDLSALMKNGVGEILNLMHHIEHLKQKGGLLQKHTSLDAMK